MLEKKFLDPRRPYGKPSKDDQEEGLIPYQPSLPISPLLYATHSKQVARLSGMRVIIAERHIAVSTGVWHMQLLALCIDTHLCHLFWVADDFGALLLLLVTQSRGHMAAYCTATVMLPPTCHKSCLHSSGLPSESAHVHMQLSAA